MTGRAKGRLAVVVLTLLLLGASLVLMTSAKARVWWIARGLSSKDPAVRDRTRQKLLDMGRPAIDSVLAEVVAGELVEQAKGTAVFAIAKHTYYADVVTYALEAKDIFGQPVPEEFTCANSGHDSGSVAQQFEQTPGDRRLVVLVFLRGNSGSQRFLHVTESYPLDPDTEEAILAAVRARLSR